MISTNSIPSPPPPTHAQAEQDHLISSKSNPFACYALSLETALCLSNEPRVICSSLYPNAVVFTNRAWTRMTGYEQHEVTGKTLACLQGPLTNLDAIREMMHNVRCSGSGSAQVINYTKSGEPYLCLIRIAPLISYDYYGDAYISNYFAVMSTSTSSSSSSSSSSSLLKANEGDTPTGGEDNDDEVLLDLIGGLSDSDEEVADQTMSDSSSLNSHSHTQITEEDGGDADASTAAAAEPAVAAAATAAAASGTVAELASFDSVSLGFGVVSPSDENRKSMFTSFHAYLL